MDGGKIIGLLVGDAVQARLSRHGYPLPGLAKTHGGSDNVFCSANYPHTTSHPVLIDMGLAHGTIGPLKPGQLSHPVLCHLHAIKHWTRIFVDTNWAQRAVVCFSDRNWEKEQLKEHISADDLLIKSLPAQPGMKFVPLLAEKSGAAREDLLHYILGVGPAPQGYDVAQHLLDRPYPDLDMTRFLDPIFVRVKDIHSVLHQRLPSVDKSITLRHDFVLGEWYQHCLGNIRLTTQAYNIAKGAHLTPLAADYIEEALFLSKRHLE